MFSKPYLSRVVEKRAVVTSVSNTIIITVHLVVVVDINAVVHEVNNPCKINNVLTPVTISK